MIWRIFIGYGILQWKIWFAAIYLFFYFLKSKNCSIPFTEGKTSSFDSSGEEDTDDENEQNGNVEVSSRPFSKRLSVLSILWAFEILYNAFSQKNFKNR